MGFIDRHCDFVVVLDAHTGTCKFPRKSIFDRSQTPCGNCDIAQKTAEHLSTDLINQRNRDKVDGRNNWLVLTNIADRFTFETSAIAFGPVDHLGPLLVRIQGGKRVR